MLDNLVIALESESQIADIGRVSVFMQKVCSRTIYTIIRFVHDHIRFEMV